MANSYDPYLYHFMRACGLPSTYYPTYIKQLTPPTLRRTRFRQALNPYITTEYASVGHPSQLGWVTDGMLVLSRSYRSEYAHILGSGPIASAITTAKHNVRVAEDRLNDTTNPFKRRGTKRTLLYLRARLLAALICEWEHDNPLMVQPPKAVTMAESDAVVFSRRQHQIDMRRMAEDRKLKAKQTHQRITLDVEWEDLKQQYDYARKEYMVARASLRIAAEQVEKARNTQRITRGARAKVPADVLAVWREAKVIFDRVAFQKIETHNAWRACKERRRHLKKAMQPPLPDMPSDAEWADA